MNKKTTKDINFKLHTYFIFEEKKKDVREVIGIIFRDYMENLKANGEKDYDRQ